MEGPQSTRHRHGGENLPQDTDISVPTSGGTTMSLKREVGLVSGISFVVGTIIGSGIFITPQIVLMNTGSVGLCMFVWATGALLSLLGTLTYTELMSVTRKSGGEYAFLMKTFGPVPAFLFTWSMEIAVGPATLSISALTFSEYLFPLLDICGSPVLPRALLAVGVLVLLGIINCISMALSARIQVFFTVAKLLALVMIIIGGFVKISQGVLSDLPSGFEGSRVSVSAIALAYYSVMFTYGGWNNVIYLMEEVKNPRRNVAISSIVGLIIVGVVYIFVNLSYFAVMSKMELYQSKAVAQTWADKVLGSASWIIPITVMMSVFGGANGILSAGSRIQYAAARDSNWWGFLSFVHVKRRTPMPTIIVRITVAIIMTLQGTVMKLIYFLSFTVWLFSGMSALSCIVLRFKVKNDPQRIKIPIIIHIIFLLVCLFLLIAPIVERPKIELLYGAVFVVGGLVIYFPLVYFDLKPRCFNTLEMYLQLLLEVSPSTYVPED